MKLLKWKVAKKPDGKPDKGKLAKLHQKLFGYKIRTYPDRTSKHSKKPIEIDGKHYYTYGGLLGGYTTEGKAFRYPDVERIADGCYLISEEKLPEVENILNSLGMGYQTGEGAGITMRGDWRRR